MLHIWPLVNTLFIVLSAIFVAFGWSAIKEKRTNVHKNYMILAAITASIFFILYMSRTIFIGNTAFGGPDTVKVFYQIFLIFHIILATVGAVMGIYTLYLGFKKKFAAHKKIGPWTSWVWFLTAITGVMVYLFLYVLYTPGKTDSLFKVILGF